MTLTLLIIFENIFVVLAKVGAASPVHDQVDRECDAVKPKQEKCVFLLFFNNNNNNNDILSPNMMTCECIKKALYCNINVFIFKCLLRVTKVSYTWL